MALRIGDMLVAAGFVTEEQVREALTEQRSSGRRLGEELVSLGFVTEVQLIQVLSNQLSVPWVSLHHIEMTRELLDLVPAEVADRYGLIPVYKRVVRREGETLFVAMDDPTNEDAIREVSRACGLPVKPMVAPPTDIRNAIRVYYLGMAPKPPEAPKRARRHTDDSVKVMTANAEAKAAESAAADVADPVSASARSTATVPESTSTKPARAPESEPVPASAVPAAAVPAADIPAADVPAADRTSATPTAAVTGSDTARAPTETAAAKPTPASKTETKPKQRFVTLTLLDGTTVRLPAQRKPSGDAEEPLRGGGLTGADLVRALLAKGQGAAVDDVLGGASWEVLCATILQLMLKKGLVADWEFVEAYKKNLGQ
jgi:type IV pilus assembly protein PilB